MSRPRFQLSALVAVCAALLAGAPAGHALGLPPLTLPPVMELPPAISGSAVQGQTLDCSSGTWLNNPTSYSYAWERDALTAIGTGNHYTVTASDVGHAITCQVTASNASGGGLPATSLPVTPISLPIAAVPISTSPPAITGNAEPGQTLTCSTGAWLNSPTNYSYSWQRNAATITGQTGSTYLVAAGDANSALTCTVVGTNASGSGPPAVSAPVIVSAPSGDGSGGSGGSGSSGGGSSGGSGGGSSGGSGGSGGGGGGGSGGTNVAKPKLKSLSVSPRKVMVTFGKKTRSTRGTSIRYSLDRAAAILLYIQQKRHGRWVSVGLIAIRHAGAGSHRVRYNARHGKKVLALGSYRVIAAAANKGGWSNARTAAFALVKKKPKPKHKTR